MNTQSTANAIEYLVLGSGRCGSGYLARVLTAAGIPCGHEAVFGPLGSAAAERARAARPELRGESSWMAVPFLDLAWVVPARKVHVSRDPLLVVASFLRRGVFRKPYTAYASFVFKHCPEVAAVGDNALLASVAHCVHWNRWIEQRVGDRVERHRIEDPVETLLERLGLRLQAPCQVPTTHNGDGATRPLDPVLIPDLKLRTALLSLRADYGYR